MSTPYDPSAGTPQDADPAAPTQFVPTAGQVPPTAQSPQQDGFAAPGPGPVDGAPASFGAPPSFGAPAPEAAPAAPQFGQAPQAPQFGQAPQAPQFGQPPQNQQFGQAPQYGQPPQGGPYTPAWGQNGAQPTQPYPTDPNAGAYPNQGQYPNGAYPPGYPNGQYPNGQYPNAGYGYGTPAKPAKGRKAAGVAGVIFGTVIGRVVVGLVIAGGIAAYHFATADPAQRASNGQVTQSGSMQATDLQVGDCFDAPSGNSNITSIKAIPCSQSHDSQVFAEPQITETSYPGNTTLSTEAKTDCGSSDTQASLTQDVPPELEVDYYVPEDATTFASQSYIICAINDSVPDLTQSYVTSASAGS